MHSVRFVVACSDSFMFFILLYETEKLPEESYQREVHQNLVDGTAKQDSLNRKIEQVYNNSLI